jgi:hypothetical protein
MQAQILAGTASANAPAISLGWRTRLVSETAGTSSTPPIQNSAPTAGLVSDVLNLTGIAPSGTGSGVGTHQTDVFVLQMSYSPTEAVQMYNVGDTAGWTEMDIVRNWHPGIDGGIQLGYLDQGTGTWEFAVQGNLPNTYPISTIYYWEKRDGSEQGQGSWSNFVADYGVTDANLGNFLGDMGVDVTTHTVWAVVDHNSQFAVIPEPATLCVLAIGGILTLARRRRA